jgi:hypothetical protein
VKTKMTLTLTKGVWTALYRVLNYHWADEYRDYLSRKPAERAGHIFKAMRTVKWWLEEVPQGDETNAEGS